MTTPIQDLIEWVRNHPGQTGKSLVIAKATELLEKEKEVIINAYDAGVWEVGCRNADSKEYYNETFNTKEK